MNITNNRVYLPVGTLWETRSHFAIINAMYNKQHMISKTICQRRYCLLALPFILTQEAISLKDNFIASLVDAREALVKNVLTNWVINLNVWGNNNPGLPVKPFALRLFARLMGFDLRFKLSMITLSPFCMDKVHTALQRRPYDTTSNRFSTLYRETSPDNMNQTYNWLVMLIWYHRRNTC